MNKLNKIIIIFVIGIIISYICPNLVFATSQSAENFSQTILLAITDEEETHQFEDDGRTGSQATGTNPIDNPDYYKPGSTDDGELDEITSKAGVIFSTISIIGIVISVLTMIVLGIKYMVGTIEERAEYKRVMMPYIVGIILIGGISTIIGIVSNLVSSIGL